MFLGSSMFLASHALFVGLFDIIHLGVQEHPHVRR